MASAYSILHNYRQETYGPNLQLMGAALQYKQNALNTNRQRIRSVYNQLGFLDMAKEEDEEYAENRLESAKSILNKYSALDLSRSSLTNDLVGKLSEVVDEPIKNAVLSTKLLRSEQAAWKKLHEDSPELYNPTNQAYAMQNANAWMEDGKVGSKYGGGGGVIEYEDLSKKIMDNLPELQKALKAEWVETVPGQGYFMALETREAVSRTDMEGAMNFLFDDKDRRQMGINAWGQYDQMPDEDLQQAYDGYFQPRIDNANQTIKDLELARGKATTAAKKAEYDQLISQWKGNRDHLEGHTFSNIVKTKGREAAYQTLYSRQFKDNILDTYSYAPRTTKREIDAVSKENRYYELKLADAAEKQRHNLAMEAKGTAVPKGQGDPEKPFVEGEQISIKPAEDNGNYIENQYAIQDEAVASMTQLFTDSGLTEDVLNSTEFKNQMHNLAGKEYLTFKDASGKEVKLSVADNIDLLQTYQNEVMSLPPAMKTAFSRIDAMLEGTGSTLKAAHWVTKDIDLSEELPNFNFRLVKGKDGNLEYKFLKHDGKTHNYSWLTARGAETEAGKKTLQLYRGLHMMHDPSLSTSERRVMKDYVNNIISELPPEVGRHINTKIVTSKGSRMKNTHSVVPHVSDFWLSEFTAGDLEQVQAQRAGHDPRISLKEHQHYQYVASHSDGINFEIQDGFRGVNSGLESAYAFKNELLPESRRFVASYGTDEYNTLKKKLGIPDPNYKMDIAMEQQFSDGQPTGNVILNYMVKNTDKDTKMKTPYVFATPKIVKKSDLEAENVVVFDTDRDSMYDARIGGSANTMYLGNNKYDRSKVFNSFELKNRPTDYYVMTNDWVSGTVAQVEEELGAEASQEISNRIKAFKRGEFDFNLVPMDGYYHMSVSSQNTDAEPFMMPLDIHNLDLATRKMYLDDPRQAIEGVFIEYLTDVRNKLEEEKL